MVSPLIHGVAAKAHGRSLSNTVGKEFGEGDMANVMGVWLSHRLRLKSLTILPVLLRDLRQALGSWLLEFLLGLISQ